MKIYYNPEMEDLPFPEPISYKLLVEKPESLEDINEVEGTKLAGVEEGAMNLSLHDSDDLPEGAINKYLLDGAVTELKLAASAVTEAKIAVNAITEAKIAADAITQNKIANADNRSVKDSCGLQNFRNCRLITNRQARLEGWFI